MRAFVITALVSICLLPSSSQAQEAGDRLRVFLDCQTHGCDFDHFRREIGFADWVRDQGDAQVHVLVTSQRTGGGGRAYTMAFLGLANFAARDDSLTYASRDTDTDAEVRDGLTNTLSLGLVSYAARLDGAERLSVTYAGPALTDTQPVDTQDPWNYWVFRINAGGFLEGESLQRFHNFDGGVSASRVTEDLKLEFDAEGFYGRSEFTDEYEDPADSTVILDSTIVSIRHSWEVEALGVWSVGEHWSVGGLLDVGASTRANQDLFVQGGPALEFNVFPYSQSTRRFLGLQLVIGGIYFKYIDESIFLRTSEGHPAHSLEARFEQRQPWGNVEARFEWLQFWHDLGVHRLEVFGHLEVRIFRGLSLRMFGSFARVKDQIYLPAESESIEDILLQQRIRGTDYQYGMHFGLSYRFGSVFNNIVNPRMR